MKERADGIGDNATSSLADDLTDEADERVWFLSETLADSWTMRLGTGGTIPKMRDSSNAL